MRDICRSFNIRVSVFPGKPQVFTNSFSQNIPIQPLDGDIVFLEDAFPAPKRHIAATKEARSPHYGIVDELADEYFMPMGVGGGIRNIEDGRHLLQVGADKVVINTAAVEIPELISQISRRFGSQCVVVSIDAKQMISGGYEVYTHAGTTSTGINPVDLATNAEELGAGEILITSIDRDGTLSGYDIELTKKVCEAVSIPVIASGGAGCYEDMAELLRQTGISAVAAASIFHFTQQTPSEAKRYIYERGVRVRL